MFHCPACDSGDAKFLGTLGSLHHFRCYDCGMEYSVPRDSDDADDPNDEAPEIDCDDSDDGYVLASAGFGTDEDYGYFGGDE